MKLNHPITNKELIIKCPVPADMKRIIADE